MLLLLLLLLLCVVTTIRRCRQPIPRRPDLSATADAGRAGHFALEAVHGEPRRGTDAMRRSVLLLAFRPRAFACTQSVPSLADPVATARPTPRSIPPNRIAEAARALRASGGMDQAVLLAAESNGSDPRAVAPGRDRPDAGYATETPGGSLRDRHHVFGAVVRPHDNIIPRRIRRLCIALSCSRYRFSGWLDRRHQFWSRCAGMKASAGQPSAVAIETRALLVANVAPTLDGNGRPDLPSWRQSIRWLWTRAPLFHRTAGSAARCRFLCRPSAPPTDAGRAPTVRDVSRHRAAAIRRPGRRPR